MQFRSEPGDLLHDVTYAVDEAEGLMLSGGGSIARDRACRCGLPDLR